MQNPFQPPVRPNFIKRTAGDEHLYVPIGSHQTRTCMHSYYPCPVVGCCIKEESANFKPVYQIFADMCQGYGAPPQVRKT